MNQRQKRNPDCFRTLRTTKPRSRRRPEFSPRTRFRLDLDSHRRVAIEQSRKLQRHEPRSKQIICISRYHVSEPTADYLPIWHFGRVSRSIFRPASVTFVL